MHNREELHLAVSTLASPFKILSDLSNYVWLWVWISLYSCQTSNDNYVDWQCHWKNMNTRLRSKHYISKIISQRVNSSHYHLDSIPDKAEFYILKLPRETLVVPENFLDSIIESLMTFVACETRRIFLYSNIFVIFSVMDTCKFTTEFRKKY